MTCSLATVIDHAIDCCIGCVCVSLRVRRLQSVQTQDCVLHPKFNRLEPENKHTHTHMRTHMHKRTQACV